MDWQSLRRMRKRARHSMRIREWPWRRKVALGAWLPVMIVGFALFTGPNHSSSAGSAPISQPKTVTTVHVAPPNPSLVEITRKLTDLRNTQNAVTYWIEATPQRLTLQQQTMKARWRSDRRKQLLEQHKAAVAVSHHRDQKKG